MDLTLSKLKPFKKKKKKRRVGRGFSSGRGRYTGRGQKGQKARSGGKKGLRLKALRKIWKKIPKRGGFRARKEKMTIVNLDKIEQKFLNGEEVNPKTLFEKRLIKDLKEKVKILSRGKLFKKLTFRVQAFSKSAENAIKKVGGAIIKIKNQR